ncbi:MAG: hypothetical protein PG981_000496 [Wolbachia endosymbiont of Ctenocephalides orientis wCori]|nr:MAG: hypothetical protein PG981_000496 [Wolbachia endosymbiont of Ctenocephalides orientis wCori]
MGNLSAQIFTKFNDIAKNNNINGLKKTYLGVLLSTELNVKTSKIEYIKAQIAALINNNNENEIKGNITVGEKKLM